ncbi:DUF7144 family membrane protein [Planomonospora parontospora]|uniref:DUF7144 family membrane protein n=1 Tax=Planomonospora parontospora TaxID=58119 RepID=UPI00166F7B00|nr:hypothetical protein [Planomonospora parontospora]GGL26989.1 hypothetical protein GCM10014719_30670 [Planomonospora parontospora subsp. antibiotica]GII16576.1 hypothetical protein Ppa05_33020 [Planomonospora parontospora subsp. antibiotica]
MANPRYAQTPHRDGSSATMPPPRHGAQQADATDRAQPTGAAPPPPVTGWVGWVMFAGITMIITGCFQAVAGLVALFNTDFYLVTASDLAIPVNYTAWGWTHLIMGAIVALAGAAVMAGRTWGRVIGITLAAVQAVANFAWFAAYPFWSAIIIAVDVFVIYALAVHGGEMRHFDRADADPR